MAVARRFSFYLVAALFLSCLLLTPLSLGYATLARAAEPAASASPQTPQIDADYTIQVTSNGWHSEIVLSADLLPAGRIPETEDFPEARYYAFGWGDAAYYQAEDPGIGTALRAAFTPTPAVLHLAGLPLAPAELHPAAEIITLQVDRAGLTDLLDFLDGGFDRGALAKAESTADGLYPYSLFYRATGEFHIFNTCNSWTARGLAAAGLPVRHEGTLSAEDLLTQLRPLTENGAKQPSLP